MDRPFAYGFKRYENRVLISVKHIIANVSNEATKLVFDIFFAECPYNDLGINSDLGLVISKRIIKDNEGSIRSGKIGPLLPVLPQKHWVQTLYRLSL